MNFMHISIDWQALSRQAMIVPLFVSPVLSTLDSFDNGIPWLFIWLIWVIAWGARLFFSCVRCAIKKHFGSATLYISILLIGLPVSVVMVRSVGHYIHLALMYPSYHQKIAQSPEAEHIFNWGDMGGFVTSSTMMRSLVYSPTSPPIFDEAEYRAEVGGNPPTTYVEHLAGNFYLQEIMWQ